MFSKQIEEMSSQSPGDALGHALHDGFAYSTEAVNIHFIVQHVAKIGNKWKAIITVIAILKKKARSAEKPEESLVHKKEPHQEYILQPPEESPDEVRYYRELQLEAEQKEAQSRLEHEVQEALTLELQRQERENEFLSHLYMEMEHEPVFTEEIEPRFDFDYVHFIAEGSLWEEAKTRHPDLEMWEAAHPAAVEEYKLRMKDLQPEEKREATPKTAYVC